MKVDNRGKNNPFFGRKHSKETKEKMRLARLKNPSNFWKGKKRPEVKSWLHTPKVIASRTGFKQSLEFRKRLSRERKGANGSNWRGGITPKNLLIRKSMKYKIWRTLVFERDDYTCQHCKQRGGELNADHIKPFAFFPKLRFELTNGRTLCVDCHRKTDTWGKNSYENFKRIPA